MTAEKRREEILRLLCEAEKQISASALARTLGVSRQIIVGDVALLRAQGHDIIALARGYILNKGAGVERVFKVQHSDEETERELNLIVDMGGTVIDVFVYHRSYGEVNAKLNIRSRHDVEEFLKDISSGKSSLLKNVTSGYHYHTIHADSTEILDLIEKALSENGFLAPLQDHEPKRLSKKQ